MVRRNYLKTCYIKKQSFKQFSAFHLNMSFFEIITINNSFQVQTGHFHNNVKKKPFRTVIMKQVKTKNRSEITAAANLFQPEKVVVMVLLVNAQ